MRRITMISALIVVALLTMAAGCPPEPPPYVAPILNEPPPPPPPPLEPVVADPLTPNRETNYCGNTFEWYWGSGLGSVKFIRHEDFLVSRNADGGEVRVHRHLVRHQFAAPPHPNDHEYWTACPYEDSTWASQPPPGPRPANPPGGGGGGGSW